MLKPLLIATPLVLVAAIAAPRGRMLMLQQADNAPAHTGSTVQNPVRPTAESQARAKRLYAQECEMCHANDGSGKTELSSSMGLKLGDFRDPKTLSGRTDGDLFDLIRKGTDKMPAETAQRAKDNDVWNLIIYIRSLGAKGNAAPAPAAPAAPADTQAPADAPAGGPAAK